MDELRLLASPNVMARRHDLAERVDTALASAQRPHTPTSLSDAAGELRAAGAIDGGAACGLAEAMEALEHGAAWEPALSRADANPARFRDAARHRAVRALARGRLGRWPQPLIDALTVLAALDTFDEVPEVAQLLRRVPVVLPTTSVLEPPRQWTPPEMAAPKQRTPIVLLHFALNGESVSWPMALHAGRAYRLDVSVQVDAWPAGAELMTIEFESDAPRMVLEAEPITVRRESMTGSGYMKPHAEIGPNNTIELVPVAEFTIPAGQLQASVVGHRSLRIATFDPTSLGSGQPMVGQRILQLLAELDGRIPNLPPQDRRDLFHLLEATGRFAAIANERRDLIGLDERGFQAILKQAFVQDRVIGRRIEEGSRLGGGPTDLKLGRIVDELKVSHNAITIDAADQFVRQPTQYASGTDSPVSLVTILDDSAKSEPPGVLSNSMRWAYPAVHGTASPATPSMVAVVIIPVNFPRPSDWSHSTGATAHGE